MSKIERWMLYPFLAVLLILFAFYDLPMMEMMYDQNNWFGRAGELFGEVPFQLLGVVAGFWIFRFRDQSKKSTNIILAILGILVAVVFAGYGGGQIHSYLNNKYTNYVWRPGWWILAPVAALYLLAGGLLAFLPKITNRKEALAWSVFFLVMYVGTLVLMNGLKFIWDRPRWRAIVTDKTGDFESYFVPWYQISFDGHFTDSEASFPSGHTMNALGWIALASASGFLSKEKGKEWMVRVAAYLWAFLVAVSRTIRGAHFPSDTTAGFLVELVFYDLMSTLFLPSLRKRFHTEEINPVIEETKAS
jgi:membrane-associated phospholipid phosphatase